MRDQRAVRAAAGVEVERQRIGLDRRRRTFGVRHRLSDEQAQRVGAHQLMQHLGAGFFEVGWQVHGQTANLTR